MRDDSRIPTNSIDPPAAGSVDAIAMLARRLAVAQAEPKAARYHDAAHYIILRDADGNERVEWLTNTLEDPARGSGTVRVHDAESLIEVVNRYKNGGTVIYGTMDPAKFVAVLNDHGDAETEIFGWRDWRAEYAVAFSREWMAWTRHSGLGAAFNSTESFALFIEDNAPDIVRPDAGTMLSIALNFRIRSATNFVSANRLSDGNIDFSYTNEVNASGASAAGSKLKVPETFTIEIPVFHGINQKKARIDARLRFRLSDGKLTLWYDLVRPQAAVDDAFRSMWDAIKTGTKMPVILGEP